MSSTKGFGELKDAITTALVDTTRTAGQISSQDLAFHHSTNASIAPLLDRQNSRLLHLARDLTRVATSGTGVATPAISNADSIDDNWRGIVDVFDSLLEKADACLDEFTGVIKRLSPSQEERIHKAAMAPGKRGPRKAFRTQSIAKPQMQFVNVPDNYDQSPFKPLLKSKPHALTSLEESLQLVTSGDGSKQYGHPYQTEILTAQTPSQASTKTEPIPPLPFDSTAATFVDTLEAVHSMLEELKQAPEIAVDLEHHDEESYLGIVSLMQISTREKDWVVDTLKPWRRDLEILNEAFTDPKILKVFHGSTMDMIWLQRDLGLYVVGLFDTYHACCALGYPKRSLAFLLKKFVNFDADKQYQMADWRMRPLPEEMFKYARSDTHYLLFVYDMMRNALMEASDMSQSDGNLIEIVMQNSKQESLQRYERPIYDAEGGRGLNGWFNILRRSPGAFSREQFAVYRALHQWRDAVSREMDVSPPSIMPNKIMYNVARGLPVDVPSLTACCQGFAYLQSEALRKHKQDIIDSVQKARVKGATGPEMLDVFGDTRIPLDHVSALNPTSTSNAEAGRITFQGVSDLSKNLLPIRSEASAFWGTTVGKAESVADQGKQRRLENLHLALPLPDLTAEVFVQSNSLGDNGNVVPDDPGSHAEHQSIKAKKANEDDLFIIKDSMKSRKRKMADTASHPASEQVQISVGHEQTDKLSVDVDAQIARREKAERKREKSNKKLERKREAQLEASTQEEETPFDYEKAPSVLHAKQSHEARSKMASKGANPYAKSLDAPNGMRRVQKEAPGKSFTFKK